MGACRAGRAANREEVARFEIRNHDRAMTDAGHPFESAAFAVTVSVKGRSAMTARES